MKGGLKDGHASKPLARVPETVFLVIRIDRIRAHKMGMVGCGMQLNDVGDYDWRETTISLSLGSPQVCVFLRTRGVAFDHIPGRESFVRISPLLMEEYGRDFDRISSFLELYRKNRFLRLGSRAFLDPWDLDSRDSFLLRMDDAEFNASFIVDPRGQPLIAELISRQGRYPPKRIRDVPGLPDPGRGKWT